MRITMNTETAAAAVRYAPTMELRAGESRMVLAASGTNNMYSPTFKKVPVMLL